MTFVWPLHGLLLFRTSLLYGMCLDVPNLSRKLAYALWQSHSAESLASLVSRKTAELATIARATPTKCSHVSVKTPRVGIPKHRRHTGLLQAVVERLPGNR